MYVFQPKIVMVAQGWVLLNLRGSSVKWPKSCFSCCCFNWTFMQEHESKLKYFPWHPVGLKWTVPVHVRRTCLRHHQAGSYLTGRVTCIFIAPSRDRHSEKKTVFKTKTFKDIAFICTKWKCKLTDRRQKGREPFFFKLSSCKAACTCQKHQNIYVHKLVAQTCLDPTANSERCWHVKACPL